MIKTYETEPTELLQKRWPSSAESKKELLDYVRPIVRDVAERGDAAVSEYTANFDHVELESFRVTADEVQEAYTLVSQAQVEALREARRRIELVESTRLNNQIFVTEIEGVTIRCGVSPLDSVGCYVPGGKAAYPSSLIMNVTPAKVAGVERIVVCTPPGRDGKVTPLTLVAADVCMVDEVYKVGGIQAVAALAYGTESIPRVNKIVGPGNRYVTAAKTLVSDRVAIDKPAGPSEIIIIADETADPYLVALDLISQAEHGPGGISGLVTTSRKLTEAVSDELNRLLPKLERGDTVSSVLSEGGFIYLVKEISDAVDFVNRFAPEHLEVMTGNPEEVAEQITSSGLVLLGDYTPVSSTDYCMGVNHVLPTEGYAKVSSGITVLDYVKPVSTVKATKNSLNRVKDRVKALAEAEGLPNHSRAVEGRFKE